MTDIVERLRTAASNNRIQAERGTTTTGEILTALGCQTKEAVASMHDESADEITRLRSLNKELAEALADLTSSLDVIWRSGLASRKDMKAELDFARAALSKYRGKE